MIANTSWKYAIVAILAATPALAQQASPETRAYQQTIAELNQAWVGARAAFFAAQDQHIVDQAKIAALEAKLPRQEPVRVRLAIMKPPTSRDQTGAFDGCGDVRLDVYQHVFASGPTSVGSAACRTSVGYGGNFSGKSGSPVGCVVPTMIKINLGCGSRHLPDPWVNCDHHRFANPDVMFDFGRDDWPFPSQSADQIDARHCLEHSRGLNHVMVEAYRVLVPGGKFEIEVPHPRSDWFIGDPTHVMPITQATLDLYSKAWCEDCQANNSANTPLALQLGVNFRMVENENHLNERWLSALLNEDGSVKNEHYFRHCVSSYSNVLDGMRFVLERV